jgi:hypothetical protein
MSVRNLILILLTSGFSYGVSLSKSIEHGNDDAEEQKKGKMYRNSTDLELVRNHGFSQTIGLRFTDLELPKGANIVEAYIQFETDEESTEETTVTIYGEKVPNAKRFGKRRYDITNRKKTSAVVSWSQIPKWLKRHEQGSLQKSANLKSIVEELVNQDGWQRGNAMVFIINGQGKRVAESYEGSHSGAATLHIEYGIEHKEVTTVSPEAGNRDLNHSVARGEQRVVEANAVGEANQPVERAERVVLDEQDERVVAPQNRNEEAVAVKVPAVDKEPVAPVEEPNFDHNEDGNFVEYAPKNSMVISSGDSKAFQEAITNPENSGKTILLEEGRYLIDPNTKIKANNLTIASKYVMDKSKAHINKTIIYSESEKSGKRYILSTGDNLNIVGITFENIGGKPITFDGQAYAGGVHHCHFESPRKDAISFEYKVTGGAVTYCYFNNTVTDEAIDIDSKNGGTFIIAYNEFKKVGDDAIEIRLAKQYEPDTKMSYKIHHNQFSGPSDEDAIQLIGYQEESTNREFYIYNNIIKNSQYMGIGCTKDANTKEKENNLGSYIKDRVEITNNHFYNNKYDISGSKNMIIKDNLFEKNKKDAILPITDIFISGVTGESTIKNNRFYKDGKKVDAVSQGKHNRVLVK